MRELQPEVWHKTKPGRKVSAEAETRCLVLVCAFTCSQEQCLKIVWCCALETESAQTYLLLAESLFDEGDRHPLEGDSSGNT